jgi:hypothetical protein
MHRLAFASALAAALCAAPAAAGADLLGLYAQVHAGGSTGKGLGGDLEDEAFHDRAAGGTYGVKLGAEIALVDVWLQHDRYFNDGTWTQLMAGLDMELDIGSAYLELGTGAGLAVATGQQVDPPLDNGEITDKGIIVEGRGGLGYRFAPFLSIGATVPVQAGYLIKSGPGTDVTGVSRGYTEASIAVLGYLRLNPKL